MHHDIQILHHDILENSHSGRPEIVTLEHTGQRGRPRKVINRDFLQWAYRLRSTTGIAHFLRVGRTLVRQSLLDYNIALPGVNPFPDDTASEVLDDSDDTGLDPPEFVQGSSRDGQHNIPVPVSTASYLSNTTNDQLDQILRNFRFEYPRAGLRVLDGMLRNQGYIVQQRRVRESLLRIDPVARVFDRVRLQQRGYKVPGPNSLWHHDGQHGKSSNSRNLYETYMLYDMQV